MMCLCCRRVKARDEVQRQRLFLDSQEAKRPVKDRLRIAYNGWYVFCFLRRNNSLKAIT